FDLSNIHWKNPSDLLQFLEKAPLILITTSVLWGIIAAAIAYPAAFFGWKWLTDLIHSAHLKSRKEKSKNTPNENYSPLGLPSNPHQNVQPREIISHTQTGGGSRNRTDA
ncbi:MAG: hypothetical protein NZL93_03555, partial [Chthoniobacterales bacterium]|nr:hypothetical protein [Chthoniobacterales bacterium]